MANGIEWFRWHHGSVTDPKFQLIARRSKQRLGDVLAVWAYVLEQASASSDRGRYGELDCESIDCLLGMDDGSAAAILAAMHDRGLLSNGAVKAWEKRQPKREREDDHSTERVRAYRKKHRHETPRNASETPRNATVTPETPREEESREEINKTPPTPPRGAAVSGFPPGFDTFWSAYPKKTAKPQAAKAFARLRPSPALLAEMLQALARQAQSDQWRRDGGQFIPHPSTWINGRRWEDQGAGGQAVASMAWENAL